MQLGDIIRSFSEDEAASEALLACNDIVLFARVGDAANRYEETVGEYASGAVRRFANLAGSEDWLGLMNVVERAGEYEDIGGKAINAFLEHALQSNWVAVVRIVPDGVDSVAQALIEMVEREGCDLILTTGGTGPAPRDLTPEATRAVITRELEGFGELMRRISLEQVPTAILSRQTAGTRGKCLIVNLPGRPSAIDVCLNAVFPAIPYRLDLIGARRIEVNPDVCAAFRPAA